MTRAMLLKIISDLEEKIKTAPPIYNVYNYGERYFYLKKLLKLQLKEFDYER